MLCCIWSLAFKTFTDGPMIYKTYLKTEHSDENIEFWLACEAYKKITSQRKRIYVARKLFTNYIQSQAPKEVIYPNMSFLFPLQNCLKCNVVYKMQQIFRSSHKVIGDSCSSSQSSSVHIISILSFTALSIRKCFICIHTPHMHVNTQLD